MIECPTCEGTGKKFVIKRNAQGEVIDDGWDPCWDCDGTGEVEEK